MSQKPAPPKDKERERIEADVAAFMKKGGKITQIEKGLSGYNSKDKAAPVKKKGR